jgi:hypothetical protein
MYYKTLQLIQNFGKQSQQGKHLSWLNRPTSVALPFNVSCVSLFADLQPTDVLASAQLDKLRTALISHNDDQTKKQLNILDWACLLESKDVNFSPEALYLMAKMMSDLWPDSFEEMYFTLPEHERKEAFIQRYFTMLKSDPSYGTEGFAKKLMAFSQGAAAKERKAHPKLFDLLKSIILKVDGNVLPNFDVNKVVFKLPDGNLVLTDEQIAENFRKGLEGLFAKAAGEIPFGIFNLFEKYFSFDGLLGMDTTLFYAIVKNKYGTELPSHAIFGFEYDYITIDITENKQGKAGISLDIQKRLTEIYIDDESQKIIEVKPPLLVHSLIHVAENNGIVEAKLENLTTVNYSKFIATLSTHILRSKEPKEG